MMTWSSRNNASRETQIPPPGVPTVKVVYDSSPRTTIRSAHGGSLLEGLRLYTLELDEHEGLRGLGRWSVICYVHGRELYCCVCVVLFKAEFNLVAPVVRPTFYSSRPGSYTMT
jgi:hypothetical protein